jgi:hypothetical protein
VVGRLTSNIRSQNRPGRGAAAQVDGESRSRWAGLTSNIPFQSRPWGWLDFTESQPGGDPDAAHPGGSWCQGVRHVIVRSIVSTNINPSLVESPPNPGETPRKLMGKNCRRGLTLSAS